MGRWGPITYTIGSSSVNSFPMAQFKSVRAATPCPSKVILIPTFIGEQSDDNQMDSFFLANWSVAFHV